MAFCSSEGQRKVVFSKINICYTHLLRIPCSHPTAHLSQTNDVTNGLGAFQAPVL